MADLLTDLRVLIESFRHRLIYRCYRLSLFARAFNNLKILPASSSCFLYLLIASVSLSLAIFFGLNSDKSPAAYSEPIATHQIPSPTMADVTAPLTDGTGSFKHYNTVAPKEEKVFPLFNNKGKTAIVTGTSSWQ